MRRSTFSLAVLVLLFICTRCEGGPRRVQGVSIRDCLLMALANNLELEIEGYNPKIRETETIEARSMFDPVFSANYKYSRSDMPSSNSFFGETLSKSKSAHFDVGVGKQFVTGGRVGFTYSFDYERTNTIFGNATTTSSSVARTARISLDITQPLLRNMGIGFNMSNIVLGRNNEKMALYQFETRVLSVLADVQKRYWDLVFALENLEVQKKSLELGRDLREITQARIKAGALAAADILRAERDISSKMDALIIAEKNVQDAEDQLKRLIRPADLDYYENVDLIPLDRPRVVIIEPSFDVHLQKALRNRPETARAKLQIRNTEIAVAQNKNQLLPKLDFAGRVFLTGLGDHTTPALRSIDRGEFLGWEAGLSLEIPIGNRASRSRYRRALLQRKQAISAYRRLQNDIIVEVRHAVREVRSAARRVASARKTSELAENQLANEENKFRAGIITLFQVQETEQNLTEARSMEIRAIVDYRKALVELERVDASLLEKLARYRINIVK